LPIQYITLLLTRRLPGYRARTLTTKLPLRTRGGLDTRHADDRFPLSDQEDAGHWKRDEQIEKCQNPWLAP
jgi:hypothetical protein